MKAQGIGEGWQVQSSLCQVATGCIACRDRLPSLPDCDSLIAFLQPVDCRRWGQ
jgi:hypothetical protein